ncbi:serine protease 1-like [Drosophila rhopaloa]|uniref:Peptidase S1 domain-containing protein n=1 Tax=Drosophila rhopaloa TaxID=1041015 RepID=A0ABM5H7G9_DRORH|nr:serine protease 1-like [Drosophila rhopaloa]
MNRRLSFFPAMKLFLLTLSVALALVAGSPTGLNRTQLLPRVTISEGPEGRIVNGYPAPEGKAPYIVGLLIRTDGSNGAAVGAGTIIASDWILTAAHCLTTDYVEIHYGSNNAWNGAFRQSVRRDNFISHPDWPAQGGRDIGLIRTPSVGFNDLINKVALPSLNEESNRFVDTWCVACGWGGMDNGNLADWLQCMDVQIISNSECEQSYGSVAATDMCTRQTDGKSGCGGDSGGPLVTHDNARLVGVIAFGSGDCHSGPSGYTRVSDYLGWIRDHTGISY